MLNILQKIKPSAKSRHIWAHLRREVIGLAQDYWKDGHWEKPPRSGNLDEPAISQTRHNATQAIKTAASARTQPADDIWHALPGEISEKMWGKGYVTPADEYITKLLVTPLGITKDMSILDLSAGLGGRLRKTAEEFGVYITGLEPDPEIAKRGMALSVATGQGKRATIETYDPMNLTMPRSYDCIIARETIYRVPDKEKFIRSIVACCKPKAQISFTDYVVNPENHEQPAIAAWRNFEQGANPIGLVELAELWAKAGISIRVHDDQTDYYKKEVKTGMAAFAKFMTSGVKPDAETKQAIEKRITGWAHRIAAIEQGMRFYRFYGLR